MKKFFLYALWISGLGMIVLESGFFTAAGVFILIVAAYIEMS